MQTLIIATLLVSGLLSFQVYGDQKDDDIEDKPLAIINDHNSINLSSNRQQLAGIKTLKLTEIQHPSEILTYGTVLSLEPLLQLRQQFLTTKVQQQSAQAKYNESQLNLTRTEYLHHQDIVSTRRLQEQQAQWHTDKAHLSAFTDEQNTIIANSRLQWGDILTDWFILFKKNIVENFLSHRSQLVQITLPVNLQLPTDTRQIYINTTTDRQTAYTAELIGKAPSIDPISQGERYFFKSTHNQIPYGSHLTAWIATNSHKITGVKLPKSAVVWHLGQALIFVKTSTLSYNRLVLSDYTSFEHDYIVKDTLQVGDEVVISGAQTLLSQQLKAFIPEEDKD